MQAYVPKRKTFIVYTIPGIGIAATSLRKMDASYGHS